MTPVCTWKSAPLPPSPPQRPAQAVGRRAFLWRVGAQRVVARTLWRTPRLSGFCGDLLLIIWRITVPITILLLLNYFELSRTILDVSGLSRTKRRSPQEAPDRREWRVSSSPAIMPAYWKDGLTRRAVLLRLPLGKPNCRAYHLPRQRNMQKRRSRHSKRSHAPLARRHSPLRREVPAYNSG